MANKPQQWIIDLINDMDPRTYSHKVSPCGTKLYAFYKNPHSEPHCVKNSEGEEWHCYSSPPEWAASQPWWGTVADFSDDEMALAEALINS